ncbi:hypothetical protein GTA08_BOTSDO01273 [Botryosphaeria dothidea]|uniref:Aldos-2-ulose dehydratase/isomerase (AUDH) Cupin domain-containing protein n=1 Tax=Botryosphaeria dothidea TaxID=55169 RepID=A0A8H4N7H5_9PEZI|nr:hypothetical protein GTA08_BOTSDO01273 [Botryosphaeria dothidea]
MAAQTLATRKGQPPILEPSFSSTVIEDNRSDGYWVEKFQFSQEDRVPGVITSGLVSGVISYLENPLAGAEYKGQDPGSVLKDAAWTKHEIGKFDSPVAVVAVDITGDGLTDLVICHDYGPHMLRCDPRGGFVTWLENPGRDGLKNGHWKERFIGRWPAMHRIKAGHFTQKSFVEIIAASVVYGPHNKASPIPVIRFQAPEKILEATEWPHDVIDDENFTVIHEVTQNKFDGPNGLDSMLIASREGLTRLYYQGGIWRRDHISEGEPREARQLLNSESPGSGDHWGTGGSDAGRVGVDPFAYIASVEPFHGNILCVYTKVDMGMNSYKWKRHVLDVFGTPAQQMKWGDGPLHYVVCGDGDDEFLVTAFGTIEYDDKGEPMKFTGEPGPNKGIFYYKPMDLRNGIFAKWKVSGDSSARLAVGDFTGNGRLDFASIKYNVKNYYEEPSPVVSLFVNDFAPRNSIDALSSIVPSLWGDEGIIYLRDPALYSTKDTLKPGLDAGKHILQPAQLPLISVGGFEISVEVYPKGHQGIEIAQGEGVKVLHGSITLKNGVQETRTPFSVKPFTSFSTTSQDGPNQADADAKTGAILLRLKPESDDAMNATWPRAEDVPVETLLDLFDQGLSLAPLKFIKVEDLPWGKSFKGVDFYNLSGFHFRFLESKTAIGHIQFWTAGTNVNCGVHNHSHDIFAEMHVSLSAGTGNGGMGRLQDKYAGLSEVEIKQLPNEAFDRLVLKALEEHGGMWERDSYGRPIRRPDKVVAYPWHKWQAGDGEAGVDVWMAVELNPDLYPEK